MNNWYQTKEDRRRVRQIVIELPSGGSRDSEFADLGLSNNYRRIMTHNWVAGFFRTHAKRGPYVLVRADGHVQELRDCPLRVAFTFYRGPSAGLFAIEVAADSVPELQRASSTGHAVFECIYGLDDSDTVERIRDAVSKDVVHICFAEKSTAMFSKAMDVSHDLIVGSPLCCRFDRVLQVPNDCRQALCQQLRELLDYHKRSRRDYQQAMKEFSAEFPEREHPILVRSETLKSQSQQKTHEKKWWEIWK